MLRVLCKACLQDPKNMDVRGMIQSLLTDTDAWQDADIESVLRYLRGSKALDLPNEVREGLAL